jgi:hypothetical protein
MTNIVQIKRKPRPLQSAYQPNAPYWMERLDNEDGSITYEVMDARPGSYRIVAWTNDDMGGNPYAKHDAEQIVRALNFMVQLNKEILPAVRETER